MALTGCAVPAEQPRPDAEITGMDAPSETPADTGDRSSLPPTDDEVMYRVFAAEILGGEGNMEQAAEEYLAAALESDDPEIARRATQVALAGQVWGYATMAADRWAQLAPQDPEALETAARTMLVAGDYVGAEHHLSALLTLSGDDPFEGWNKVAQLLSAAPHREMTDRVLQHLMEEHDALANPFALFAQSQVAARSGDLDGAAELADRAIAGAPQRPELYAWAGRVAVNREARVAALAYYQSAWSLDPENRVHAMLYAELLRQSGAGDHANEILASLPDTPDVRFTRLAFALQSGNREFAEELYLGFETAGYEDAEERAFQAARSAELLEWPEQAIYWYEQIEGGENGLIALGRMAFLYADMGRLNDARRVLAEARQGGNPDTQIESWVLESQILIEVKQSAAAYEVLTAAMQRFPGETRLLYTRALVGVELGKLEEAERDLRVVIARNPQNAAALNALGYTLADQTDRYQEAEQLIRAAYQLDPDEVSIIDSMGWVAYRLGRLEEAEAFLRQALTLDRNPEIAAHLGEVLWVRGRKADAQSIWMVGLAIDPTNKVLVETLDRYGIKP